MAQLVVGLAGAAIGSAFGAPGIGWAIGASIGGMLGPRQRAEGPRLSDLKVTAAEYGAPIPVIYGHPRTAGVAVWASDKREIATTTRQGKGGGPESTSYTYEVDVLYLLSANLIAGVRRIWANGKLVYSVAVESDGETVEASEDATTWRALRVYTGADNQLPDPIYEAAVGVGNATAYRGRGSIMLEGVQLGSGGQLPNFTFEVAQGWVPSQDTYFSAPFEEDARDVMPDPLAVEIINAAPTFDDGWAFIPQTYPGGSQVKWTGDKLGPLLEGQVFTVEWHMGLMGLFGDPEGLGMELCGLLGPGGMSARFGITRLDGDWKVFCRKTQGASDESAVVGDLPSGGVYRIVCNARAPGSLDFFLDSVNVWSVSISTTSFTEIFLGSSTPASSWGLAEIRSQYVIGYFGDSPAQTWALKSLPLADMVADLCAQCGIGAGDIDVSALAGQEVHAVAVQPTAARAVLEQLATAYYFECVESDKLYFRRRGAAPVATIPYGDYGADGLLTLQDANDLELPAQVNVSYLNLANAYQQGNEVSDRITTESTAVSSVQLGMGLTPAVAKAIADTAVLDQTVAARTGSATLDMRYARLEPTDVVLLTDGAGLQHRARIVKIADADGVRSLDLVADDARVLRELGITSEDYDDDYTVMPLADTDLVILDIPILRDQDDNAGLYAAGDGLRGRWPGYLLLRDGTEVGRSATGAAMGVVAEALGNWASLLVDEANIITVTVNPGDELVSITHADLSVSTSNYAAIGAPGRWEIVQYQRAALVSEGVYRVSGLARGRLGTEHLRGTHVAGDRFVALDGAGLLRDVGNVGDLGIARTYMAVTQGARIDDGTTVTATPHWQGLRPLSPVGARQLKQGNGDIVLQWGRRSRYVGNVLMGVLPLGEAAEAYEVDVLNGATVVRTLASSTPTATYTAAQQVTDFGGEQAAVSARIYQLSASIGRGQPASL